MEFIPPEESDNPDDEPNFTLKDVQDYFDTTVTSFYLYPPDSITQKDEQNLMPLWDKGQFIKQNGKYIAEIPILAPVTIITDMPRSYFLTRPRKNEYTNTGYNLIAEQNTDGTFLFTVARITGNIQYLRERKNKKLHGLTLGDIEHFSGKIFYFATDGQFLTGGVYKNGHKTGTISNLRFARPFTLGVDSLPISPIGIRRDSLIRYDTTRATETVCHEESEWVDDYDCWEVFVDETSYGIHCEVSGGHYEYYEVCEEVEVPDPEPTDPDYPGGGGGGWDDDETRQTLTPKTPWSLWTNRNSCHGMPEQTVGNYAAKSCKTMGKTTPEAR